jgi:flagellin-specific chaperone FliS
MLKSYLKKDGKSNRYNKFCSNMTINKKRIIMITTSSLITINKTINVIEQKNCKKHNNTMNKCKNVKGESKICEDEEDT